MSLNKIVKRSNMVRDAFLNRLLLFLRSSRQLLSHLEMPTVIVRSEFDSMYEEMPTSLLKAIETVFADPFYYLRLAAEERFETGLYLPDLPPRLIGFSCHLDERSVPGTKRHREMQKKVEQMFRELDAIETTPSSKPSRPKEAKK